MTTTPNHARVGAATLVLAPAVMLAAFLTHPYLTTLPDAQAIAAVVEADTTRWALAHLLAAVGSALIAAAFLAVRAHLRDAGEERFSRWGVAFVVFGSAVYAFLPGLEFAPLAAVETGGDAAAVQEALTPWFVPALATAAVTFAIGALAFARGIAASGVLGRGATATVVTALVVMAVARTVPLGLVQFHVQAIAGIVALWPLAGAVWPRTRPAARGRQASPAI